MRKIGLFPGVCCLTFCGPVWCHALHGEPELAWVWEPWVLTLLAVAGSVYAAGWLRMHREGNPARVLGAARVLAFGAGIAVLFIALESPLDSLAGALFSAHMVQHLLLMLLAPPLLVWSRPVLVWLWAFPLAWRRRIGKFWNGTAALHGSHTFLMRPLVVWLMASGALWFWHLPGPYDWALENEGVHAFEHACFFLTSLAFWTLVAQPYGRRQAGYGTALVLVATFALHNGLLGALLTFAGAPLYQAYTEPVLGFTPLEDQQLAGLIMWVPASIVHLATLAMLFVGWLSKKEGYAPKPILTTGELGVANDA
jgi:cytochrome c oxidase assembly factor CtaG